MAASAQTTLPADLPASQSHARLVLGAAWPPAGAPSHAYLFHGPSGSGKAAAALAFAAALLADGASDPSAASARVLRRHHPDLTWVEPTGAAEILVDDIEEPVIAAATRTPFEARRRLFVIERADRMNDAAAGRLLKTLEEPPPYVHLILLADDVEAVLPTLRSRCQVVRFAPAPATELAARLAAEQGIDAARAGACARLAGGDARLAARLATAEGAELRAAAEDYVRGAIGGAPTGAAVDVIFTRADETGKAAGAAARAAGEGLAAALPKAERRRALREGEVAERRSKRRASTETIDLVLRLTALWLRDLAALADGAGEVVRAVDRPGALAEDAERCRDGAALREAVLDVEHARTTLALNPNETLMLTALGLRLAQRLSG